MVSMDETNPPNAARTTHRLSRRDLAWAFAYPIYQLIGTVRHEGSHALAVLLEGGKVVKFVFWPTWTREFYWGYVQWTGAGLDWLVSAAPYFGDLVTFGVFYLVCTRARIRRHWIWVNLYAVGLLSPLLDSGYRYASSFFRAGDLTSVMRAVPPAAVHAYFVLTLASYIAAMARMQRLGSPASRAEGNVRPHP